MPLGKFLLNRNIGEDADYVGVSIPVTPKEGTEYSGIDTVFAVADYHKSIALNPKHNMLLGSATVVIPLGRDHWNEARRYLQSLSAIGNDVKGITSVVNGVIGDLNAIDAGYDILKGRNVQSPSPIDKAIEGTGKVDSLLGNVTSIQGYFPE